MSGSNPIGALPGVMVGIDLNNDGKTDLIVAGSDFNRDGIPDALQHENGAVFAAPDSLKVLQQVPPIPLVSSSQTNATLLQAQPTSARRLVTTGPAKVFKPLEAQFCGFEQVHN